MATIDITVAASADDAVEDRDGTDFSSTALNAAHKVDDPVRMGFLFKNVTLPVNSYLVESYISLYNTKLASTEFRATIFFEDPGGDPYNDCDDFSTNPDVASRTLLGGGLLGQNWLSETLTNNAYNNSPTLNHIWQWLSRRDEYVSGGDWVVIVDTWPADDDEVAEIRMYDGAAAEAAKLHIEYEMGVWPPVVDLNVTGETPSLSGGDLTVQIWNHNYDHVLDPNDRGMAHYGEANSYHDDYPLYLRTTWPSPTHSNNILPSVQPQPVTVEPPLIVPVPLVWVHEPTVTAPFDFTNGLPRLPQQLDHSDYGVDWVYSPHRNGNFIISDGGGFIDNSGLIDFRMRFKILEPHSMEGSVQLFAEAVGGGGSRLQLQFSNAGNNPHTNPSRIQLGIWDGADWTWITSGLVAQCFPSFNTAYWVRFTKDPSTGTGDVYIYTSADNTQDPDAVSWTVRSNGASSGVTSLQTDGDDLYLLGNASVSRGSIGALYARAEQNSAVVAEFDPGTDAGGQDSWTSSGAGGEDWEISPNLGSADREYAQLVTADGPAKLYQRGVFIPELTYHVDVPLLSDTTVFDSHSVSQGGVILTPQFIDETTLPAPSLINSLTVDPPLIDLSAAVNAPELHHGLEVPFFVGPAEITYVDGTSDSVASQTSVTTDKPSGLQDDDVLVAFVVRNDDDATEITCPGFTEELFETWTDEYENQAALLYKVVTDAASEPSTYTFSTDGIARNMGVHLLAFRNVDTSDPIDATGATERVDTNIFNFGGITPSHRGSMTVAFANANSSEAPTTPTDIVLQNYGYGEWTEAESLHAHRVNSISAYRVAGAEAKVDVSPWGELVLPGQAHFLDMTEETDGGVIAVSLKPLEQGSASDTLPFLFEPRIMPRLEVPLESVAPSLYEPSLTTTVTVTAPLIDLAVTPPAPTVSTTVDVAAPLVDASATLSEPTVDLELTPPQLSAAPSLPVPELITSSDLLPPLHTVATTLHAPSMDLTMVMPLIGASPTVPTPIVSTEVTVAAPLLSAAAGLSAPTVTTTVTVTVPLIASSVSTPVPSISTTVDVEVPLAPTVASLYEPAVGGANSVIAPLVDAAASVSEPVVLNSQLAEAPLHSAGPAVFAPAVSTQTTLTLTEWVANWNPFWNMAVIWTLGGVPAVHMVSEAPLLSAGPTLHEPTVTPQSTVEPPVASPGTVHAPDVSVGAATLEAPVLTGPFPGPIFPGDITPGSGMAAVLHPQVNTEIIAPLIDAAPTFTPPGKVSTTVRAPLLPAQPFLFAPGVALATHDPVGVTQLIDTQDRLVVIEVTERSLDLAAGDRVVVVAVDERSQIVTGLDRSQGTDVTDAGTQEKQ